MGAFMGIFEKAKEYYPKVWTKEMLRKLVVAGKLTEEQYIEIVGVETVSKGGEQY